MDTDVCCSFFTGTLRELAVNLQRTFALVNSNKIASHEEIEKLKAEKAELQKTVAQADAQRSAAIAQLQSCRRQLTSMGGTERDSDVKPIGSVAISMNINEAKSPIVTRPRHATAAIAPLPSSTLNPPPPTTNSSMSTSMLLMTPTEPSPANTPEASPDVKPMASKPASARKILIAPISPIDENADSSPVHRPSSAISPRSAKVTSFKDASKGASDVTIESLTSQLEVMKMVMDQLEQDKQNLQKEVKQHQADKKLLIKEFKALRATIATQNTATTPPPTSS